MNMPAPDEPHTELDFEQSLSELQRIVAELEEGSIGLEPSLARFEQGVKLLRHCSQVLDQAEQRIEVLTRLDAEGNFETEPFDGTATTDRPRSTKPAARPKKSPASAVEPPDRPALF